MKTGVLYISYTGMLEPLGQSQVLAYQEQLAAGYAIHLISFERAHDWADANKRRALAERLRGAGIAWHPLHYHKRPSALATLWDIACGTAVGWWLVRRHGLAIVHARSYIAALMALWLKRLTGVRFLFDMRGFWADERVEGGLWPSGGRMYRIAKGCERRFLLGADHVVSLTQAAVGEMQRFPYLAARMPPVTVIPTCADLGRFHPLQGLRGDGFVLGYVGSAGTWYLFESAVACFLQLRDMRPEARLLIINRGEHDYIRACLAAGGVPQEAYELREAAHGEVAGQMARMHAAVFFIKPVFSKQASAPTKLGEFLGCGIPCLSNQGVGDMAAILEGEGVGVALPDLGEAALRLGLERLLALAGSDGVGARCVAAAQRHFSLEQGVGRYRAVYRSLAAP